MIPLKQWRAEQANRLGTTIRAIEMRWCRWKYPVLRRQAYYKNSRVVFVDATIGAR